ncbi:MAG TPA: response regulator transcription factor [Terriglobia bacterium]|nr:response regulator transcription factor [Terriglobia bacterium]
MVTVGIVSSRKLMRRALCSFLLDLSLGGGIFISFDVDIFADASEGLTTSKPQILLIDCEGMAECLSYLHRVRELSPLTKCLLLTENADEEYEVRAARNGAWGMITKGDDPELVEQALETVLRGEMWFSREILGKAIQSLVRRRHPEESVLDRLTAREGEVTALLARGFQNREIAQTLFLSENTIRKYTETIYRKLGVNSRLEVALMYHKYPAVS